MRIRTSRDFLRARRLRRAWSVGAGATALLILVVLLPEWLEVQWLIYPLPRVAVEIMQNLFWAFTTSTIFMLFESSVNGGGSLLERYRDIENSVAPLSSAHFSTEFLRRPSDPNEAAQFDNGMITASALGRDGIKQFVTEWGGNIEFDAYERTLECYTQHAEQWQEQVARNVLVFSPEGLEDEFENSFQSRCRELAAAVATWRRGARNGPYWVLEEDMGRGALLVFDNAVSEDSAYEVIACKIEAFADAQRTLLSATKLRVDDTTANHFMLATSAQFSWDFFYAPIGGDADWATTQGSRELVASLPSVTAVEERDFWLAPPKWILNPKVLCMLWEEAVELSKLVDRYNEMLAEDLRRARDIALAQS